MSERQVALLDETLRHRRVLAACVPSFDVGGEA